MDDDIDEPVDDEPDDSDEAEDLEEEAMEEGDLDEEEGADLEEDGADLEEDGGDLAEEGADEGLLTLAVPSEPTPPDEAEEQGEAEEAEASLDEILRERLQPGGGAEYEAEEEAERQVATPEAEVSPRRANEFVCRSCFLVKSRNQLADPDRLICLDCADTS